MIFTRISSATNLKTYEQAKKFLNPGNAQPSSEGSLKEKNGY